MKLRGIFFAAIVVSCGVLNKTNNNDDGTDGSSSNGGNENSNSSSGGTPGGGESNAGSNTDEAPGGTVEPTKSTSHFPLSLNDSWTYEVNGGTTSCESGERTVKVREKFLDNGIEKFKMDSVCDYFGPGSQITWKEKEDAFSVVATSAISKIYSHPPEDGRSWQVNHSLNSKWEKTDAIVVQAGTFSDCFKAVHDRWGGWGIYCKGVGLVKSGSSSTNMTAELKSFSIQ